MTSETSILASLDLVWIEDEAMATVTESGVVMMLNNAGGRIVQLAQGGFCRKEIEQALVDLSGLSEDQIRKDLADLEASVQKAIDKSNKTRGKSKHVVPLETPLPNATYALFENRVQINYPNHEFSSFLHPYFAAFQVQSGKPDLVLDIELQGPVCYIRCGAAEFTELSKISANILGAMCQALTFHDQPSHEKTNNYMHCSVVLGPQGAWLISGASGKGKTTLAATLDAAGYTVLAEDIVPIDPFARVIYPVPTTMTIKAKGWERFVEMFPEHADTKAWKRGHREVIVRKVAPHNPARSCDRKGHKIAGFLFPNRNEDDTVVIEPMGLKDAMVSLCDKYGHFPGNQSDLSALAACVDNAPKYRLHYHEAKSLLPKLIPLL